MLVFFKSKFTAQSTESWLKTVLFFQEYGYPAQLVVGHPTWDKLPGRLAIMTPFVRKLSGILLKRFLLSKLTELPAGSICWCVGAPAGDITFEKRIKWLGHKYIFNLLDDWFSVPQLRNTALERIRIADLVAVPTRELQQRILSEFPGARVEVFEEVLDVNAFELIQSNSFHAKKVVWNGRRGNAKHIYEIARSLELAYNSVPFDLLLYGDSKRPDIELPLPWRWSPFSREGEAKALSASRAGLDPVGTSLYDSCKGNYKVKVYLASGVPVIASPVGINTRLIKPGFNGFLPATDEDWTAALLKLVSDDPLYHEMSGNAREFAIRHLSHEAVLPQWIESLSINISLPSQALIK